MDRRNGVNSAAAPVWEIELTHPKYRADIDGLRALAVLSVVGYHAAPSWVKGGFIGVDIFFVISGFLISTIIFENIQRNSFSFIEFYSRRIRRIFPALFIVLTACFAFGWFALFDDEFKQLGKHIAGGAWFISNFVLWNESGYFDNAASTKPLLHLWSLGIEEQFYIVWPLLLWAASKKKLNWFAIISTIVAVSFALNLYSAHYNAIADFYSPQTRFWELLVGSVLAYAALSKQKTSVFFDQIAADAIRHIIPIQAKIQNNVVLRNCVSSLGILAVVASVMLITDDKRYPGAWALLPTLGTAMLIVAGTQTWINHRILANPVFVWFGLISYPLYLWHWPLLTFTRIFENETPKGVIRLEVIIISIVLSWMTFRLVELPIRSGKSNQSKSFILLVLMIVIGGVGYATYKLNGIQTRAFAQKGRALFEYRYFYDFDAADKAFWGKANCFNLKDSYQFYEDNGCEKIAFPNRDKVFLLGDSLSAFLGLGLRSYLNSREINLFQYSAGYCPPLFEDDTNERCSQINKHVRQMIKNEKPKILILFANYMSYSKSEIPFETFILEQMLEYQKLGVQKIILLGQIPTWEPGLPTILLRSFFLKGKKIPKRTYEGVTKRSLDWDEKMKEQKYSSFVRYVSLKDFLCNNSGCLTTVGPDLKNDLIVFDWGHLTKSGAAFISNNLLAKILP
jgi:peptidoglycan/LPS O-acetylase OafA/YrhL